MAGSSAALGVLPRKRAAATAADSAPSASGLLRGEQSTAATAGSATSPGASLGVLPRKRAATAGSAPTAPGLLRRKRATTASPTTASGVRARHGVRLDGPALRGRCLLGPPGRAGRQPPGSGPGARGMAVRATGAPDRRGSLLRPGTAGSTAASADHAGLLRPSRAPAALSAPPRRSAAPKPGRCMQRGARDVRSCGSGSRDRCGAMGPTDPPTSPTGRRRRSSSSGLRTCTCRRR